MCNFDGIEKIHHSDEYHKKREDINMHGRSINNLKTICVNQSSNLKHVVNLQCLLKYCYSELCETWFWEYYQNSNAFYKVDTAISHETTFDLSTIKVSKLFDQSLSQDDAEQTSASLQPVLCDKTERINNRYYLKFKGALRMISNINLNPASGEEDIVNIFIVYKLNSIPSHYWVNGIMGHNNAGYDKVLGLTTGNLAISGTANIFITIGSNNVNGHTPIASFKSKANASDLNKWVYLSCHWNLPSEISYVFCNEKIIANSTSRQSVGSNNLTFADWNPSGISGMDVCIACFLLYKNRRYVSTRHKIIS